MNLGSIDISIEIIKNTIIIIGSLLTLYKLIGINIKSNKIVMVLQILNCIIEAIIATLLKHSINYVASISSFIFFFCILIYNKKENAISNILYIIISISINYIILFVTVFIVYVINKLYIIKNDYINLFSILIIYTIILKKVLSIKRIKKGISSFKIKYKEKNYLKVLFAMMISNISMIIFLCVIVFSNVNQNIVLSKGVSLFFILFSVIMFLTIKKSIEAYYKQKLLIQDLNETKKELEDKKKEIEDLEAENLRFSKKAHSLAHKQKSLEFKINKILINSEIAEEIGIESELKNISKQLLENAKLPKLDKTGIYEIDDMFDVMQEECRLNGIDFVLQLKGNIYQMINHHITKDELAVLLADHIKDAIIAINHSDNLNKSIMVRLGKIEECFAVYFYDSGVEFPKKVFDSLGKKPITTHSNEGGTGMGFMNTFDLLNKYSASLIIENIGKPSKDNYTKIIKIIFDNKNNILFNNSFFDNK